jgi:hypothetical protein
MGQACFCRKAFPAPPPERRDDPFVTKRVTEQLVSARESVTSLLYELETARNERDVARKERDLASQARRVALEELERQRAVSFDLAGQVDRIGRDRDALEDVVAEYGKLVRSLEDKRPLPSSYHPGLASPPESERSEVTSLERVSSTSSSGLQSVDNARSAIKHLQEGRLGLSRLLSESNSTIARLESTVSTLTASLRNTEDSLASERSTASELRAQLSETQSALLAAQADDSAADKLLESYASFFQSCQNHLYDILTDTKNRHAATVSTLSTRVGALETALEAERSRSERLRTAVDDMARDLTREAFGRRTEVKLRLEQVRREQELVEWLEDSRRKASTSGSSQEDLGTGAVSHGLLSPFDAPSIGELTLDDLKLATAAARPFHPLLQNAALMQDLVTSLLEELDAETSRRAQLERSIALDDVDDPTSQMPLLSLEDSPSTDGADPASERRQSFQEAPPGGVRDEKITWPDIETGSLAQEAPPPTDAPSPAPSPSAQQSAARPESTRPTPLSVNTPTTANNPAINTLSSLVRALPPMPPSTPSSPSLGPDFVGTSLASQVRLLYGPLKDELSALGLAFDQLRSDLSLHSPLSSALSSSASSSSRVCDSLVSKMTAAEGRLRELRVDIEIAQVDGERAANVFEAQARLNGSGGGVSDDSPLSQVTPSFESLSLRVSRLSHDVADLRVAISQMDVTPPPAASSVVPSDEEEDNNGVMRGGFNPLQTLFEWSGALSSSSSSPALSTRRLRPPPPKQSLSFGDATRQATWGGGPRKLSPEAGGIGNGTPSSSPSSLSPTFPPRMNRSVSMNDVVLRTSRSTPTLGLGPSASGRLVGLPAAVANRRGGRRGSGLGRRGDEADEEGGKRSSGSDDGSGTESSSDDDGDGDDVE